MPGPHRGCPATQAVGDGPDLLVDGAPSAGASPREPGGRGTEELAVGPSERVVVGLGVGIVVLSALNAGIMLKRRWLSMWGLAGMLGFLALLIAGMVEAVLYLGSPLRALDLAAASADCRTVAQGL